MREWELHVRVKSSNNEITCYSSLLESKEFEWVINLWQTTENQWYNDVTLKK